MVFDHVNFTSFTSGQAENSDSQLNGKAIDTILHMQYRIKYDILLRS